MLTADAVYNVAKALPKKELRILHAKISKDLAKSKVSSKLKEKPYRISQEEMIDRLFTEVFKVNIPNNRQS